MSIMICKITRNLYFTINNTKQSIKMDLRNVSWPYLQFSVAIASKTFCIHLSTDKSKLFTMLHLTHSFLFQTFWEMIASASIHKLTFLFNASRQNSKLYHNSINDILLFCLLFRNGGKFIIGNDLEWETPLCKLLKQST